MVHLQYYKHTRKLHENAALLLSTFEMVVLSSKEILIAVLQCRPRAKEKMKHLLEYELSVQHCLWY